MHELDQVYLEGMIPWNRIRKEIDNFRNLETWYYFEQCKHYGRQKAKRKRLIYGRLQVTYDHQPYQDWCCHTWAGAPVGINLSNHKDLLYHSNLAEITELSFEQQKLHGWHMDGE